MSDLRSYLSRVDRAGQLWRVPRPVSRRFEIAAVTAAADGSNALLFEDVRGGFRVVSNLVGTRRRLEMAVGGAGVHARITAAMRAAKRPGRAPGRFMANRSGDLRRLPVVTHFEKEPGPFITSSVIYARNPETGRQNSSFHRMMPVGKKSLTVRMVEGRHLHRCFEDARAHGEDLRVAVAIGVHPAISVAGACQAEWGRDEMLIANSLLGGRLRLARLPYSGLDVPSGAEIVLEGRIRRDATSKEWMVEMLRTYDHAREQPVFELESMYHRDDPVYHDILSGYTEHRLLMGVPAEAKLAGGLSRAFRGTRRVTLSAGGCGWLHAVVQIRKRGDGDPGRVIREAFRIHRSLKQVTVVDEDIDPDSAESVEYAVATRFQADRDLVVLRGVRGSSLDPSSDQARLRTAKTGIDATRPLSKRPEGFELARIPGAGRTRLGRYVRNLSES